ncbi:hypothetical protein AKJ56_01355 [candidate division MSBL1 archaeon SCGC-AAA382N08]|uniref:Uncharacterized protein n=1 Tax=candidate division MSBL1 archaeon SCGC-AAA382N08 TaxID=1698285 RepID=A0A133VPR7_9EURY|nr:hypothetical protein AKJ56_01355 [candidate division MSBL1 archaeon SCGC-AAA382N08]
MEEKIDEHAPMKKELLEKYAEDRRDVHEFTQIDGWKNHKGKPHFLGEFDEDGDWLCMSHTHEIRASPAELAVRVFIHRGTTRREAVRLVKKTLESLKGERSIDEGIIANPATEKEELLEKYAKERRDVHKFIQFDGWNVRNGDDFVKPDEDGDWLCSSKTYELRASPADLAVRTFIHKGAMREETIRLLEKILESVKEGGAWDFETGEPLEITSYEGGE